MDSDVNYRFAIDDDVLCYFGPLIYEAKCLQRRMSNDGLEEYFVNVKGWEEKFNLWIKGNVLMDASKVNMRKMAVVKEIYVQSQKIDPKSTILLQKVEEERKSKHEKKSLTYSQMSPVKIIQIFENMDILSASPIIIESEDNIFIDHSSNYIVEEE